MELTTATRIALVTESFYPAVDGTTPTVRAVADRLIDRGHPVCLVAPGPGLGSYRSAPVVRVGQAGRPGRQLRDALAGFRPDLVVVSSPGTVGRRVLELADRLGVPAVVVQAAPVPEPGGLRWRTAVADRAERVLVTAGWMRDRLASLDVPSSCWTPGVDAAAFTPALRDQWLHDSWARSRSAAGPRVVVGYVGSLHRRHDVRRLAELASVPGIRPVLVGDGPERGWLRSRLPEARIAGALGTGDLTIAVPSLDVLVHPGESETCSHAVRAAQAAGVPVVAPRTGGARDVVRHLETGLLYDPAREWALASAVASVAADPRRAMLGHRGRELATRTWREAVDELVDEHLAAVLGRQPAPGALLVR